MELRIWDSTAVDSTLQPADDSYPFTLSVKTHVEGKTTQELIDREREEIISKVQTYINKYKKARQIETNAVVTGLIADIDGTVAS
jgi:hypothetical protein